MASKGGTERCEGNWVIIQAFCHDGALKGSVGVEMHLTAC